MERASLTTTLLNVALLPTESTSTQIERLSAESEPLGGLFQLDGRQRFAHLTLYMARFADANIESVLARTADAVKSLPPMMVRHTGYFVTPGNYYEASFAKSDGVMAVHDLLIDTLLPLRFSPGDPVVEKYFGPYSAGQRAQAEETGYDLARDLYRPHITITRFAQAPVVALPVAAVDLSFTATRIGLFKADPLGAVTEPVAVWSL